MGGYMEDTNLIPVACDEMYPVVAVERCNLQYAKLLLPGLNNGKSETSAVMAYMYQHWVLDCQYPLIGNTVYRIGKVEMHHMEMLGELITLLGARPSFCCCKHACWSGSMLDYSTDLKSMLLNNIRDEEGAVHFYLSTAKIIKDERICILLKRIAKDEELHMQIFKNLLCNI